MLVELGCSNTPMLPQKRKGVLLQFVFRVYVVYADRRISPLHRSSIRLLEGESRKSNTTTGKYREGRRCLHMSLAAKMNAEL